MEFVVYHAHHNSVLIMNSNECVSFVICLNSLRHAELNATSLKRHFFHDRNNLVRNTLYCCVYISTSLHPSYAIFHSVIYSLCITLNFGIKLAELMLALNSYVIDWGQRHALCVSNINILNSITKHL